MPPEWNTHEGTWLAWPHNRETWPKNFTEAQAEWINLANAISEDEQVHVVVGPAHIATAREKLGKRSEIELVPIKTNDAWIRDFGPTFVKDQASNAMFAVSWNYNCWGEKYPPFDEDQKVAARIAGHSGFDLVTTNIIAEGGAIETNGNGDLLTTKSCLANDNRNAGIPLTEIESQLKRMCGVDRVWWYSGPHLTGDDTDGHIDQQARFCSNHTVLVNKSNDTEHRFELDSDDQSHPFTLIEIPVPGQKIVHGEIIPASYLNFCITNRSIIVPQFNDSADASAVEMIAQQFPDRQVVKLPSLNLSFGLGSFHCLTQQQPALSR
jgi:agmatine deiminase